MNFRNYGALPGSPGFTELEFWKEIDGKIYCASSSFPSQFLNDKDLLEARICYFEERFSNHAKGIIETDPYVPPVHVYEKEEWDELQ